MAHAPLVRALVAGMRATHAVGKLAHIVERVGAGLALTRLDPDQLSALTAAIYAARGDYAVRDLTDWEREWFAADLPPAPARLLVGGAGSGREVAALLAAGYEVFAFDPAASFVAQARRRLPQAGLLGVEVGAYEDLLRPGSPLAAAAARYAPFHAVLLGWGSFTHVPGADRREATLIALDRLCPRGPLLLSCWLRESGPIGARGRPFTVGRWLGRLSAGGAGSAACDDGDAVLGRCGYVHAFTPDELAALAASVGRRCSRPITRGQVYPHATLVPDRSEPEAEPAPPLSAPTAAAPPAPRPTGDAPRR